MSGASYDDQVSSVTGRRDPCPFCGIAEGREPTDLVYADDMIIAFPPLRPATPGHVLVVPRQHFADVWELTDEVSAHLADVVLRLSKAVRKALRPDGLNIITSAGAAATQTVPHIHVHLVPRRWGDGFGPIWPKESPVSADQAKECAALVRAAAESVPSSHQTCSDNDQDDG